MARAQDVSFRPLSGVKFAISNSDKRSKLLCSLTDVSIRVLQEYHVQCSLDVITVVETGC